RGAPAPRPWRTPQTRCGPATGARSAREAAAGSTRPARGRPPRPAPDEPDGGHPSMKLGFLTAPFPDTPLMDVADWAAGEGFEVLEIACWPRSGGSPRRYPGTRHTP